MTERSHRLSHRHRGIRLMCRLNDAMNACPRVFPSHCNRCPGAIGQARRGGAGGGHERSRRGRSSFDAGSASHHLKVGGRQRPTRWVTIEGKGGGAIPRLFHESPSHRRTGEGPVPRVIDLQELQRPPRHVHLRRLSQGCVRRHRVLRVRRMTSRRSLADGLSRSAWFTLGVSRRVSATTKLHTAVLGAQPTQGRALDAPSGRR